jgi:signal transduction histidine kinase
MSDSLTSISSFEAARGRRLHDTSLISDSEASLAARESARFPEDAAASFPLSLRAVLLLTAAFWAYVTLTDILYAEGMRIDVAQYTTSMVFASWELRLVQHVLVFPILAGCYWVSSRVGWTPLHRRLPAQIGLAIVFAVLPFWMMDVANLIVYPGFEWLPPGGPRKADMAIWFASTVAGIPTYGFGLALVSGAALYRRIHGLKLRNAELKSDWAGARLAALRTQLSPHTLFNLLHNIQAQIPWDPEVARSSVVSLAELLRRLLRAGEHDFSLLSDEMHFVKLYFALQLTRFADRMTVHLPDLDALPAVWVPSLILQPLVENAVVHGLDNHSGPVRVEVTVELTADEALLLRVVNSGGARAGTEGPGIGLRNVRERLALQFGGRASLHSGPRDATTWVAELRLPVLREWRPPVSRTAAPA